MTIQNVLMSLLRRWYLTLAAIAISVGLVVAAAGYLPSNYQMKASMVLVPPKSKEDPTANRYLSLGGLSQALTVVVRASSSEPAHDRVAKAAPGSDFTVEPDVTTSAPIMLLTITGPNASTVRTAMSAVQTEVAANVLHLQDELAIPESARIVAIKLTQDTQPSPNNRSKMRALAVLVVVLIAVSGLSVGALDGLLLRRRQRSRAVRRLAGVDGAETSDHPLPVAHFRVSTTGQDEAHEVTASKKRSRPGIAARR